MHKKYRIYLNKNNIYDKRFIFIFLNFFVIFKFQNIIDILLFIYK